MFSLEFFNRYFALLYTDSSVKNPYSYQLTTGPYKGIYTTKAAFQYYTQLDRDLKKIQNPHGQILFFDEFPAGYLFTTMRPAANTIWLRSMTIASTEDRQATMAYFKKNSIRPTFIVKIISLPDFIIPAINAHDPLNLMTKKYQLILRRKGYEIFKLKSR